MNDKVSILIPAHRNPEKLSRCLASLRDQTLLPDEVMVIYERGDTDTENEIKKISVGNKLNIIPLPLRKMDRMTRVINTGIRAVCGDIIAFLDQDIVVPEEWVKQIVKQFEDDDIVACGGKDIITVNGKRVAFPETPVVGILKWKGYIVGNQHRGNRTGEVMFLKGCNMAVKREELRMLDENLIGFIRWEQDIFFNLLKIDKKIIYNPGITVNHIKDDLHYISPLWTFWYGHNTIYLFLKYFKGMDRLLAILFYIFIGDGSSPGYALLPLWLLKRRLSGFCTFATAQIGKMKGFLTYFMSEKD